MQTKTLKGTVNIISSDPPCNICKARFITVPSINLYLINDVEDIVVFLCLKVFNSNNYFMILPPEKAQFKKLVFKIIKLQI